MIRVAAVAVLGVVLGVSAGCGPAQPATTQPAVEATGGATTKPTSGEATAEDDAFDLSLVPGRIHVVQPNETLYGLAERYYGNGDHWRKIFFANRNRVKDPKALPVGMRLIIP